MNGIRTDPSAFNRQKMRDAWRSLAGLPAEKVETKRVMPSLEKLRESEWSTGFEQMMRDRLVMGAFRYGLLNAPGKPSWDRMGSVKRRAELYAKTGDVQLLADIANLCLLEFEEGDHPLRHIGAGDCEEHVSKR